MTFLGLVLTLGLGAISATASAQESPYEFIPMASERALIEAWTSPATSLTQVIHVTGEVLDPGAYYDIQVERDANSKIVGMAMLKNGALVGRFALANLIAKNTVLIRQSDKDAILLRAFNFDPIKGGGVRLIYLNDGVSNTFQTLDLSLRVNGPQVKAYTAAGVPFSKMYLYKKTWLGMTVGISKIVVSP